MPLTPASAVFSSTFCLTGRGAWYWVPPHPSSPTFSLGFCRMDDSIRQSFLDLGSNYAKQLGFRDSWVFIGAKNIKSKSPFEKVRLGTTFTPHSRGRVLCSGGWPRSGHLGKSFRKQGYTQRAGPFSASSSDTPAASVSDEDAEKVHGKVEMTGRMKGGSGRGWRTSCQASSSSYDLALPWVLHLPRGPLDPF